MSTNGGGNETPELSPAVTAALTGGRVVEAIKILREERGIGLKEAKEAVGRYVNANPALKRKLDAQQAESLRGCLLWLVVLTVISWIVYFAIIGK